MILVVGSTGMVGSEICRLLASKGIPFRALVRESSDPAKVERLKGYGAQLVKGNLCDTASLKTACQGVSAVICTVSAMPFCYQPGVNDIQSVDFEGVTNLIEAAKAAGVKHLIYTSFSGNLDREFPLRNAKRTVEQRLKESGLVYTILRPSMFMEVWLSPAVGFDAANSKATVYGTGDQLIAWITIKDVAQFAVESLENPAARNRVLELGGPKPLSPHQVIKIFEDAMGKTFEVTHVPPEALQAQYAGATDPMQKSFIGLMLCYAGGDPIDMSAIQKAFAVHLTPIKEYVAGMKAPA
ncbi:MAG: SDR family oxidoreductase [Anaerolineaceae bacterium]